jgi:hypothetical protein
MSVQAAMCAYVAELYPLLRGYFISAREVCGAAGHS